MTKISIAMATYNGASHLGDQLESLMRQLRLPDELVVTDDGSTDNTVRLVDEFSRTAPFPVILHQNQTRLGYRLNFSRCASLCGGDIILFCDQDDIWWPNKLSSILEVFNSEDCAAIIHNARIFGTDLHGKSLYGFTDHADFANHCQRNYFFLPYGFTMAFRSDLVPLIDLIHHSVDFNEPTLIEAHDQWVYFLANAIGRIYYIAEPLVDYRRHDQNVTQLLAAKSRLYIFYRNIERIGYLKFGLWAGVNARLNALISISTRGYDVDQALQTHRILRIYLWRIYRCYSDISLWRRLRWFKLRLKASEFYQSNGILVQLARASIDLIFGVLASKGIDSPRKSLKSDSFTEF